VALSAEVVEAADSSMLFIGALEGTEPASREATADAPVRGALGTYWEVEEVFLAMLVGVGKMNVEDEELGVSDTRIRLVVVVAVDESVTEVEVLLSCLGSMWSHRLPKPTRMCSAVIPIVDVGEEAARSFIFAHLMRSLTSLYPLATQISYILHLIWAMSWLTIHRENHNCGHGDLTCMQSNHHNQPASSDTL